MLVDKTNFGLAIYNHANFYQFEERASYWSVKRISDFLCFSLVNQPYTSGITVYNRTVTNVGNTGRTVHSCNSWFDYMCNYKHRFYTSIVTVMLAGPTQFANLNIFIFDNKD